LNKLQKNFYYSKLSAAINATTNSIFSNSIQIVMHRRIPVITGITEQYTVYFNAQLENESFRTSNFTTTITGQQYEVYIADSHVDAGESIGNLVMKRVVDDTIVSTVGTIDYNAGVVNIPTLLIDSVSGGESELRFYVEPFGFSPNIFTTGLTNTSEVATRAIFPFSARNTVISLDASATNSSANIIPGLTVSAIGRSQE